MRSPKNCQSAMESVSNCHTGLQRLDWPRQYAAVPPADLRDPRRTNRGADRPRGRGLGAGGAHRDAVRRSAGGAGGDGGVSAADGGADGHDASVAPRAGRAAPASRPALELGEPGAPRRNVPALLRRRVRGRRDRVRRARDVVFGPARGAPLAPAVATHRRAGGLDTPDPAARTAPGGRGGGAPAGRARVRGAAPGAARARHRARRCAREGARGGALDSRTAMDVLAAETERLSRLAKEFSDFGRLPEGPKSEVDLVDLLTDLGRSAVPPEVQVTVRANGEPSKLLGQYDPLRR